MDNSAQSIRKVAGSWSKLESLGWDVYNAKASSSMASEGRLEFHSSAFPLGNLASPAAKSPHHRQGK